MSLEILLGSTDEKTFFAVFDRALLGKNVPPAGRGMGESNPNGNILIRRRDGSEHVIASSEELIEKNRELLEPPNLPLLCQCLLVLSCGPTFQVIEDVKNYANLFERNREKMTILYDIESLAEPKIIDGKLIFFAQDLSRSIPVKVIVENFKGPEMRFTILLLPEKIGD